MQQKHWSWQSSKSFSSRWAQECRPVAYASAKKQFGRRRECDSILRWHHFDALSNWKTLSILTSSHVFMFSWTNQSSELCHAWPACLSSLLIHSLVRADSDRLFSPCAHSFIDRKRDDTMKMVSALLLLFLNFSALTADRTIRRLKYKLDSDITALVSDNIISYELTRIESTATMSTLEIETEQWVHDCCFTVTAQPVLRIRLKSETNYPRITVYLSLRTPLSSIVMTGTGNLLTTNPIQSDALVFELSGTSKAQLQVEILSKLDVIISGTGQMVITGHVKGTGYVRLGGAGEFDGRTCPMNSVIVDVIGVGTVYVVGEQAVDVAVGGVGQVYYHGPLRNQRVTGVGSIDSLSNAVARAFRSSATDGKSSSDYLVLFSCCSFLIRLIHGF